MLWISVINLLVEIQGRRIRVIDLLLLVEAESQMTGIGVVHLLTKV
jgi:hypothetical protein